MKKPRRFVSLRMDVDLYDSVVVHRQRMEDESHEGVDVPVRAAIEDLIRRGLRGVEQ